VPDPAGPDREALATRRAEINSKLASEHDAAVRMISIAGIAVCAAAVCAYLFFTAAPGEVWWPPLAGIGTVVMLLVGMVFAQIALSIRTENRIRRGDLEQLEFESELMAYEASAAERRAEKLLSINEQQLRRYYNLNLSQGLWVLMTGIGCVAVGIAVVGWTFYAVAQAREQTEAQIVIGAVGAVGAILINYVAAVYLRIHASAAESFTAFHARLASTHELFLANLLISRVSEAHRDDVLCTLAVEIVKRGTGEPKS
jgi:uncharacterized membrane protein